MDKRVRTRRKPPDARCGGRGGEEERGKGARGEDDGEHEPYIGGARGMVMASLAWNDTLSDSAVANSLAFLSTIRPYQESHLLLPSDMSRFALCHTTSPLFASDHLRRSGPRPATVAAASALVIVLLVFGQFVVPASFRHATYVYSNDQLQVERSPSDIVARVLPPGLPSPLNPDTCAYSFRREPGHVYHAAVNIPNDQSTVAKSTHHGSAAFNLKRVSLPPYAT